MTLKEVNRPKSPPDVDELDDLDLDLSQTDPAGSETVDTADEDKDPSAAADQESSKKTRRQLRLSLSLRTLVVGVMVAALVGAVSVLAWLYIGAQHKLDAQARQAENVTHAERVALDYAVNAAEINSTDFNAWKVKLVAGTTPELNDKLTKAAQEMEQILIPLQWNSTAHPLAAKVRSDIGGVYVVDCFVSVFTKTVQAPDPLQSTATYSITIDSKNNWQISDVGGIGDVVGHK